jgi:hypothetical protein
MAVTGSHAHQNAPSLRLVKPERPPRASVWVFSDDEHWYGGGMDEVFGDSVEE